MPKPARARVLLVEDTLSLARVYQEYLRDEPYEVSHVETGAEALEALRRAAPQALLLDVKLPDMNGLEVLKHVRAQDMPTSVVVMTAHGSISVAVEAMRLGAFDFLVKPFNAERLVYTLRNALERQRLATYVETLKQDFDRNEYCGFIGASLPMQAVYRIIDSAASSKATVFITGESGTGKELCAEAIHAKSPRRDAAMVPLNCTAIPKDLMESEIFGHVKGSFTGAIRDRDGAASRANGGTLFLDEICDMDLNLQTKLLRFVQTGSFQKVGGNRIEQVDVRFVCATNRDPMSEVAAGRFREDLYYRLHVIPIHLPPLHERDEDVLMIARRFLVDFAAEEGKRFKRYDPVVERVFLGFDWPGNVRQMQNVIRNIVVLNDGETVTRAMLPAPLDAVEPKGGAPAAAPVSGAEAPAEAKDEAELARLIKPLWQVEKEAIERAIDLCGGNIPKAAERLGLSASTIYRKRLAWNGKEEA